MLQLLISWPSYFNFLSIFIFLISTFNFVSQHPRTQRRTPLGRPPPPFSVLLRDAKTNNSSMVLSCINIPPHLCHPSTQQKLKPRSFTRRNRCLQCTHGWLYKFLSFLLLQSSTSVLFIPGTNHAIISGQSSLDTFRQQRYVDTIIHNCTNNSSVTSNSAKPCYPPHSPPPSTPSSSSAPLKQETCCFITDTDSETYIIDLAANRFIVNDASLMTNLRLTKATIKGIGGVATTIKGIGSITIQLESDDGRPDSVTIHDAVYVPSSPYNLLPQHLLIARMKSIGYIVHHSFHDDVEYIFNYRLPVESSTNMRHLTVPIGPNKLFHFSTRSGFTAFFKRAKDCAPFFAAFTGEVHHIYHDDEPLSETLSSGKSREYFNPSHTISPGTTRESSTADVFDHPKATPIEERFHLDSTIPL